jgi:hypothetical protein
VNWIGTVLRDKTQWKQIDGRALHRPGPEQTPSAGIGTVPEYWTEQIGLKHVKRLMCFSTVTGF